MDADEIVREIAHYPAAGLLTLLRPCWLIRPFSCVC